MTGNLVSIAIGALGIPLFIVAAWRRPTQALILWVISSVVLSEYILLPDATTLHIHLSRVFLFALLTGLAVGSIAQRKRRTISAYPELLMVALIAWTIVSAWLAGTIFRVDGMRNVSVFLTGFFIPVLILYLVRSRRLSLPASRSAGALLNVLLGYLIFTAFCEHFHVNWLVFPQYILDPSIGIHPERARGPVVNAAENGAIIAVLMLTALHQILHANIGVVRRAAGLGLLLFGIPALWFTETRGPWLALVGGLLVMLWHKRCRGLVLALGAACVLILAAVVLLSDVPIANLAKLDLLPQRAENTSDTTEFRLDLYSESVAPFQEHPVIGWGLGTFTDEDYLFDAYGHSLTIGTAVLHDTTLAIALESGIIGAILYISFLIGMFLSLSRLRRASRSFEKRDFYTMCLAALTVFVISGIFVDNRYFMPMNALVFLISGLGLSLPPTDRQQSRKSVAEPDAVTSGFAFPAVVPASATGSISKGACPL